MCDTFYISPSDSDEGYPIFCKNSDRPIGESQGILLLPLHHTEEEKKEGEHREKKLTYISVPSWRRENSVILGRPFWMWGAEMGANSSGVAIGNEAIFTKLKHGYEKSEKRRKNEKKNYGLLGMDALRIALEVARSSWEAVDIITAYIEKYGQDVNSAFDRKLRYYNSFLVADRKGDVFYVETIGRAWVVKKLKSSYAISNEMCIREDYDLSNELLYELSGEKGSGEIRKKINIKDTFEDKIYTFFTGARLRRKSVFDKLEGKKRDKKGKKISGRLSVVDCFDILRSHIEKPDIDFQLGRWIRVSIPSQSVSSVCMHSEGFFSPSETANSMVAVLRDRFPMTVWFTGTPHACLSVFKPFFLNNGSGLSISPSGRYDGGLWWLGYEIHSLLLYVFTDMIENFKKDIADIQEKLIELERKVVSGHLLSDQNEITVWGIEREKELLMKYREKMSKYRIGEIIMKKSKRPFVFLWRMYHSLRYGVRFV